MLSKTHFNEPMAIKSFSYFEKSVVKWNNNIFDVSDDLDSHSEDHQETEFTKSMDDMETQTES